MLDASMLDAYLADTRQLNHSHPAIQQQAILLAASGGSTEEIAARCFAFVRDEIRHSWDSRDSLPNPVTCIASDVLLHRTGYCYAKSHLLAALLRANGIPAGLCYQRLSVSGQGAPYCLHGLNAAWLEGHGWYRIDARGNKPGVAAEFCPPQEKLAFPIAENSEANLPGIWAEPHPQVVAVLERYQDVAEVYAHLPDVAPEDWVLPQ